MKRYEKPEVNVITLACDNLLHSISGEVGGPVGSPRRQVVDIIDECDDDFIIMEEKRRGVDF